LRTTTGGVNERGEALTVAIGATAPAPPPRLVIAATDTGRPSFRNVRNEERLAVVYRSDGGSAEMRDTARDMQKGGVGWYADPFAHVDTGRMRGRNFRSFSESPSTARILRPGGPRRR